jgi:uncharacterized protein (TIGR00375 family)
MFDLWSRKKGVTVLGTGDALHTDWQKELQLKLTPCNNGLYKLKKDFVHPDHHLYSHKDVYFIVQTEVNCIYRWDNKTRRIHLTLLLSSLDAAFKLSTQLRRFGNITADGRPCLKLDSRDLLEMALSVDEHCLLIPAHIWTPWYSVLGAKSGFDSLEECFRDLVNSVFAVETGLSSDPAMNREVAFLDPVTLVSSSDAHSPESIGREATWFNTIPSYGNILKAIKHGDETSGFYGTVEFFPEEGKYFLDGHRKCNTFHSPLNCNIGTEICPACNKRLTQGVLGRVLRLKNQTTGLKSIKTERFIKVTPLVNILSQMLNCSSKSRKHTIEYEKYIQSLGSELEILVSLPVEFIRKKAPELSSFIEKMRIGNVTVSPGFDGVFGTVSVNL